MEQTLEIKDLQELNRIRKITKRAVEATFTAIKSRQAVKEPVNKELLLLDSILGDILHRAFEILDTSKVKYFTSVASSRGIFEIEGIGPSYYIFPKVPNCQCRVFRENIDSKKELFCKHIIAVQLAQSLNRFETVEFTNKQDFSKFVASKLSSL